MLRIYMAIQVPVSCASYFYCYSIYINYACGPDLHNYLQTLRIYMARNLDYKRK